jgi:hypothetical protein
VIYSLPNIVGGGHAMAQAVNRRPLTAENHLGDEQ